MPEDYDAAQAWPVILFLHGAGPQGTDGLRHTTGGVANSIRLNRPVFSTIAVFPQAQPNTQWHNTLMQDLAIAALDKTMAEFRVDADRVYLTGSSILGCAASVRAFDYDEPADRTVRVSGGHLGPLPVSC